MSFERKLGWFKIGSSNENLMSKQTSEAEEAVPAGHEAESETDNFELEKEEFGGPFKRPEPEDITATKEFEARLDKAGPQIDPDIPEEDIEEATAKLKAYKEQDRRIKENEQRQGKQFKEAA